jgi:hypothetical protein
VNAAELQELLNGLSSGDMVRLTRAQFTTAFGQFTTAFGMHGSIGHQQRAATNLANLYGCDTRFIRGRSTFYVVFTRRQA